MVKMIDFLFIIVRFPSISQNDRSIKSFVWKNRSFNQIVLSVQKSWFSQSLLSKQFFFQVRLSEKFRNRL